jgi:hypothetical protein
MMTNRSEFFTLNCRRIWWLPRFDHSTTLDQAIWRRTHNLMIPLAKRKVAEMSSCGVLSFREWHGSILWFGRSIAVVQKQDCYFCRLVSPIWLMASITALQYMTQVIVVTFSIRYETHIYKTAKIPSHHQQHTNRRSCLSHALHLYLHISISAEFCALILGENSYKC